MQEYIEFYYPASGQYTYKIVFDWGEYIITTEMPGGEEVHAESKKYLGYITRRPTIAELPMEKNCQYI